MAKSRHWDTQVYCSTCGKASPALENPSRIPAWMRKNDWVRAGTAIFCDKCKCNIRPQALRKARRK